MASIYRNLFAISLEGILNSHTLYYKNIWTFIRKPKQIIEEILKYMIYTRVTWFSFEKFHVNNYTWISHEICFMWISLETVIWIIRIINTYSHYTGLFYSLLHIHYDRFHWYGYNCDPSNYRNFLCNLLHIFQYYIL